MTNLQPLEVVDRGSETQPQVVAKLNKLIELINQERIKVTALVFSKKKKKNGKQKLA